MAKTSIIRLPDGDRTPFLRGILVRSLVRIGLSFDAAHSFANKIRDGLRNVDEITGVELQNRVAAALEKDFGGKTRRMYEARNQPRSDIVVHTRTRSMSFSTAVLCHSLEACAISPRQAMSGADRVHAAIRSTGHNEIDHKSLRRLIYRCLRDHCSDTAADRYLAWRRFYSSGKPLIILLGGVPGTGKSTVAAELAYRLNIAGTQSTDMMRDIIRSYLAPQVAPTLQYSSFDAWRALSTPRRGGSVDNSRIIDGFLAQLTAMKPALQATLSRAILEKQHLVMEGVHLVPNEIDLDQARGKAVILQLMMATLDKSSLRERRAKHTRMRSENRGANDHESVDDIWELQSWLLDIADAENITIMSNLEIEDTIRDILDLASIEINRQFPPDEGFRELDK